jgi:pimeloyl-ACP methyl ester carboxylesterase
VKTCIRVSDSSIYSIFPLGIDGIPEGFDGQYIDVMGQRIRYYQTGSGPDILFIHGSPGSLEEWAPVMDELSKRYRLTFYDRPGQGFSSGNNLKYTVDENADFALALIEKLKLQNPVVAGESFGGSIVMGLAVRNPENIKAFVAVSPATITDGWKPEMLFYLLKTPVIGTVLIQLFKCFGGSGMIRDGILIAAHPNENAIPPGYIDKRLVIWKQPKVVKALTYEHITILNEMDRISSLYGKISKPVFLVHGEDDQIVPVSHSIKAHGMIPGSRLLLIKETGHMLHFARTAELLKVIGEAAG